MCSNELRFWGQWARGNKLLFLDYPKVKPKLESHGFEVNRVEENTDNEGISWCEVDMVKPDVLK